VIVTRRTLRAGVATRPIVLISARGVTAPHIVGKGRAEAHPKSLARVTVCRLRAMLRPTRDATQRTLRAEVAQRLNVLISAQRVAPPHILYKSLAEARSTFPTRVAASSHQAMGLSKSCPLSVDHTFYRAARTRAPTPPRYRTFCTAKIEQRRPLDWPDPILYRPLALLPICRPATAGVSGTASGNDRDLIRA